MSSLLSVVHQCKLGIENFRGKGLVGVERQIVCVKYLFSGGC